MDKVSLIGEMRQSGWVSFEEFYIALWWSSIHWNKPVLDLQHIFLEYCRTQEMGCCSEPASPSTSLFPLVITGLLEDKQFCLGVCAEVWLYHLLSFPSWHFVFTDIYEIERKEPLSSFATVFLMWCMKKELQCGSLSSWICWIPLGNCSLNFYQ